MNLLAPDSHVTIDNPHLGDIIKFGKGSADFSEDMFQRSTQEGHTDDLIITYSPAQWANSDTITIENYFSQTAGLRLSTYVTSDGVSHEFIASDDEITPDDLQNNNGKANIEKDATGEIKVDASEYYSPSNKGVVINNKSTNAVLNVAGSFYGDTINTSKSTGDNTIVESFGNNKITTGKGNDYFQADYYSSNTINVGDGNNIVILDNAGTNKVTAGNGDDIVSVSNYSSNTINVGNGNNEVTLDSIGANKVTAGDDNNIISAYTGINTITLGKGNNDVILNDGINTVKTGSGDNVFTIFYGNNTINSGASKTQIEKVDDFYVGGDQYYINGGNNTIKTTGATYVSITGSAANTITTGKKDDVFEIGGSINNINGDAGNDTYIFNSLAEDNQTIIADSKGNDIYDFTNIDSFDGLVAIADKNGSDTIKLADNSLKLFFDGTYNKKTGTFTFCKSVVFAEEVTTNIINGIEITGKAADKLNIVCADNSLYDINALKGEVTAWFADHNAYKSVDAVFDGGNQDDINTLLHVYNTGNYVPINE